MPENPLLPDAQLQALHTLLLEAVHQGRKRQAKARRHALPGLLSQEALLAGTLLQLAAGDILVGRAGDTSASRLSDARHKPADGLPSPLDLPAGAPHLALAGGLAAALRQASSDRIVLCFLSAAEPHSRWAETLSAAQNGRHPLLIVCADASGPETFRPSSDPDTPPPASAWSWTAVQRHASRLQLPVLSVDGEDAVAVYRVAQESILRARAGGGPAILWAMLPTPAQIDAGRPKSASPRRRLEQFLTAHHIKF